MHRLLLGILVTGLTAVTLRAQVTVELKVNQSQYLPRESVVAALRITNFSGQTLRFGLDNAWLTFSIENSTGFFMEQVEEAPVQGEFDLDTACVATKRVDLGDAFHLTRPGLYTITASVRLPDWDRELTTPPVKFEVIPGAVLWEQDFGVPGTGREGRPPQIRKYALMQALHQGQLKLYLRISDSSVRKIHRLVTLGPTLSYSDPEQQIDRESNLHLLFQDGARRFNYSAVDPEGNLVARQTFEYSDTRPTLQADVEGKISVKGGLRQVSLTDVPPPVIASPPTNAPASIPPTNAPAATAASAGTGVPSAVPPGVAKP